MLDSTLGTQRIHIAMCWVLATTCVLVIVAGCASTRSDDHSQSRLPKVQKTCKSPCSTSTRENEASKGTSLPVVETVDQNEERTPPSILPVSVDTDTQLVAFQQKSETLPAKTTLVLVPQLEEVDEQLDDTDKALEWPEEIPAGSPSLTLDDVLRSVYDSYPLLHVARQQRGIAAGELLEAHGEFDFKLKGGGTTGPLGFYETNRFGTGFEQALFGGGEVFAGYRIGRGNFQPWYGERETNDGGEFKAGFQIPLVQNRRIDPRRAAIMRAALGRDAVEPNIFLQLIDFVRAASYAYWGCVGAGQDVQIAQSLLDIAQDRQKGIQKRVDSGDLPRIDLTDNERLIVSRHAALIDTRRKLMQSSIKLSLFLRTPDGQPNLLPLDQLPTEFQTAQPYDESQLEADIQIALASRPELQFLDFVREQLEVDLQQARNLYLPEVGVGLVGSQDIGAPASAKGDKTPFEMEASLFVSVPLQRRKARGKIRATRAKLMQVTTKTRFAADKVSADVQNAVAGMKAAYQRIEQARQSVELNLKMEQAERIRFDQGDSNLLIVNLREKATADARKTLVAVLLEYFQAEADYQAALATIPIPKP